jgi:DNA-binding SARP family transcriptional activator
MATAPARDVQTLKEQSTEEPAIPAELLPAVDERQRAHSLLQYVLRQHQSLGQIIQDLTDELVPRNMPARVDIVPLAEHQMPEHQITARFLGTFELAIDGVAVQGWRSGRARALLQYLLPHHDRSASREALIQALWPEPDAAAAATSLKVAVHSLRQVLSESQPLDRTPAVSVRASSCGYQLSVAGQLWLDTEQFEKSYSRARRLEADGQLEMARSEFARAAELYRGEFLPDAWDDWVVLRREHLRDTHLLVLARLADFDFEDGCYNSCIHWCEQLLAEDRCREDTYRLLMRCHSRLGQPGRVRRWFELCTRTLLTDLGVEVDSDTREEYQRALRESSPARRAGTSHQLVEARFSPRLTRI